MRFRQFSATATTDSYLSRWYWPTRDRSAYEHTDLVTRSSYVHQMLDVVTPGFLTYRNNGGIVCSPMIHEEIYYDIKHTALHCDGTDYGLPLIYDAHTPYGLQVQSVNSVCSEDLMWPEFEKFERFTALAITRAHANVNLSEMNVLASLGELPETLRWIQSIVKRILKLTKAFRRRQETLGLLSDMRKAVKNNGQPSDFRRLLTYSQSLGKRRLKKAANSGKKTGGLDLFMNLWLEYRYAVRPLIIDLQNALKALDRILSDERFTARGREYHIGESEYIDVLPPFSNPTGDTIGVTVKISSTDLIKARAGCLYVLDAKLASLWEVLGFDQPIEAIYELIPFSFILDWVFSIGDLIESWFKSSGLSILTSWVTLQVEHTEERKVLSAVKPDEPNFTFFNQQFVLGSSHVTLKRKWRLPNPSLPLLPRFDLKLDLAKIIDLGAIGRAAIGGKVPEVARRM